MEKIYAFLFFLSYDSMVGGMAWKRYIYKNKLHSKLRKKCCFCNDMQKNCGCIVSYMRKMAGICKLRMSL